MASGIWHLACQTYALKLFNFHYSLNQTQFLFSSPRSFRVAKSAPSSRFFQAMFSSGPSTTFSETSLVRSSATSSAKLSSISKWLLKPPLVFKPPLWFRASLLSKLFSKSALFFVVLLLSYSQCSVALTAHTSRVIEGSAPYLTFDGGRTKAISTDSLLSIKLQDGQVITPSTNTSSVSNPIRLPYAGNTLDDIDMIVPSSTNSVSLSDLVTRYNYWRDDDGDGQGGNGVTASGSISVSFRDKSNSTVNRNEALSICKAPYRVRLSSTGGYLQTQYGVPSRTSFSGATVDYYINPYDNASVCHAAPNLYLGGTQRPGDDSKYFGSLNEWHGNVGFVPQSSYDRNFPTTGADGLYFDLDMKGIDASQLTWSTFRRGGITATVTNIARDDSWSVFLEGRVVARVKLSGPRADDTQINSSRPSRLTPSLSLPQTVVLVGRDSRGNEVRYGFVLKQWFVNRGNKLDTQSNQSTWCSRLGYRIARVSDLTNSSYSSLGATPRSSGNHYKRHIGAGFFTEWGGMYAYADAGFVYAHYWTSDAAGSDGFTVYSDDGHVSSYSASYSDYAVCTAP
ncbi:hypothetical protein [Gilliamella sp. Pas-s95]|uniref:hypothetical protein n=1 Tax=Gilliamella sp. Pas-s95 TaxID=2687317 RepID=UPI0013290A6C|nr:hypothetical protein [Gilliamella sp. Pas-s95]MWN05652.1 hypothetical protein [Gilliamella sp. Pas-s95]